MYSSFRSIFSLFLLVVCYFFLANSAFANKKTSDPIPLSWNSHRGFYVEAGVGPNAFYALLPTGDEGTIKGWGVATALGYYFLDNIAVESGYIYSSQLNASVEEDVVGITVSASAAAKLYIPYLALRFGVPIAQRVAIIFKLGGMYPYGTADVSASFGGISAQGRISDDHLLPFSGIGATYALSPKIELNLLYQGAVYVLASGAVLSVGFTAHFD